MSLDVEIASPTDEREVRTFARIAARSLGLPFSDERAMALVGRFGTENLRLVRSGGEIVAGLGVIPMGHWLGGRSVGCLGVSVVSVSPEHRSRGIATELMRTVLEEARRDGVAVSSLFPATFPLYRAAGYEGAGTRIVQRLALRSLGEGPTAPAMRAATAEDHAEIRRIYDARVRPLSGPTDRSRSPAFWSRVLDATSDDARAYLVEGEDGFEGYVVVTERPSPEQVAARELAVRDAVALSPAAASRILRFLADHRSIWRSATLASGPAEPLLLAARDTRPEIVEMQTWMVRILDVRTAFEQRGWRTAVRGELHLDVRDGLLRENARRWVLDVSYGRGHVREGGTGSLVIDVRGLAALFTGHLTAEELGSAGLCEGGQESLALATALFAGPAPWTPDFF